MKQIYCSNHPHKLKKAVCFICNKAICEECISIIAGKAYCKSCGYGVISEAEVLYLKKIYKAIAEEKKLDCLKDKRKYQRIHIINAVEIYDENKDKKVNGIIIDISPGDMSIITDEAFSIKDRVQLDFTLTDVLKFKNIQGGVIRVQKIGDKYHVAITLMNLGENKNKIQDFIIGRLKRKYIRGDIGYV